MSSLVDAMMDPARPAFTFGACPPREGTTPEEAVESAKKFCERAWVLACDGFIVYDIQDEAGRTSAPRPFPFRATIEPAGFGKLLSDHSGKQCVIYKSVGEPSVKAFDQWLDACQDVHGHNALNLVGAATSSRDVPGPTLGDAAARVGVRPTCEFGCVTIAERHLKKGTEHENIQRKVDLGAQWFISQAVYNPGATCELLNDYGDLCKRRGIAPKKVVLTFAPCGRRKTMAFIKWLGVSVPAEVEGAILEGAPCEDPKPKIADVKAASATSVKVCVKLLNDSLQAILEATASSGVPLGINVESVSGYAEECEASYALFHACQRTLLTHHYKQNWAVRWCPVGPAAEQEEAGKARAAKQRNGGPSASLPGHAAMQLLAAGGAGALAVLLTLKLKAGK